MWVWVIIELINGVVHPLWSLRQRGYTPGVITAPILLVLAIYLLVQLRGRPPTGCAPILDSLRLMRRMGLEQ